MSWIALIFLLASSGLLLVKRRELAKMQAMIFGGAIVPGCIIAEAVVLALLAVAVFIAFSRN